MKVLAVDPGVLSGVAVVEFTEDGTAHILTAHEVPTTEVYGAIKVAVGTYPDAALVSEAFTITARTARVRAPNDSLEIIGAMKALAHDLGRGWEAVTLQRPSDAKHLVSNDMLRDIGAWYRGGEGHANDALRHAVLYAVRNGWQPSNTDTDTANNG
jgi:hypothetical protein